MIRNITAKRATAVTQADFFSKLCQAMPKEFFKASPGEGVYGYYRDLLQLDCLKANGSSVCETYVFRITQELSKVTQAAIKDFMDDVRRVAKRGGYDEVKSKTNLFAESFYLAQEKPTEFRLLVKN